MSPRRFVVGVSGSAGSLQALRYAALLARSDGAALAPVLAWSRAIELAIGGAPVDVEFSPGVVRGEAGHALTEMAREPGDVLVIGAGQRGVLARLLGRRVSRYCPAHARCPLVAVPPAQLAGELQGLHGWVVRRRLHPEDIGLRTAGT